MIVINLEKAKQIALESLTPKNDTPQIRAAILASQSIEQLKQCFL